MNELAKRLTEKAKESGMEIEISTPMFALMNNQTLYRGRRRKHPILVYLKSIRQWRMIPYRDLIAITECSNQLIIDDIDKVCSMILRDFEWVMSRAITQLPKKQSFRKEFGYRARPYHYGARVKIRKLVY